MSNSDLTKHIAAMTAAAADIAQQGVAKAGHNREQNYKYRSIDDVLQIFGPILPKHGITMQCSYDIVKNETFTTQKGTLGTSVLLRGSFVFVTAYGQQECHTFGEAKDFADKAFNKAMTAAFKYALVLTFVPPIKGLDDGDNDHPHAVNDTRGDAVAAAVLSQPELDAWQDKMDDAATLQELIDIYKSAAGMCVKRHDAQAQELLRAKAAEIKQSKGWAS